MLSAIRGKIPPLVSVVATRAPWTQSRAAWLPGDPQEHDQHTTCLPIAVLAFGRNLSWHSSELSCSRARGVGEHALSRLSSLVGAGCLALLAVSAAATVAAAGAAKGATLVKLAPNRCFCSASCRASLLPRGKRVRRVRGKQLSGCKS